MSIRSQAVVDTGFWGACCRLGIHIYLDRIWNDPIIIPGAVLAEIFKQPGKASLLPWWTVFGPAAWGPFFPDQSAFMTAFVHRLVRPGNPTNSMSTNLKSEWRSG